MLLLGTVIALLLLTATVKFLRVEKAADERAEPAWVQEDELEGNATDSGEIDVIDGYEELEDSEREAEDRERLEEQERLAQFDQWAAKEEQERQRIYAMEQGHASGLAAQEPPLTLQQNGGVQSGPGRQLGNYFLGDSHDSDAYKKSRIVFLHNNKAGGKSVNTMLKNEARLQGRTVTHASLDMRMTLSDTLLANSEILYGGYVMDLCSDESLGNGKDCSLITLLRRPIDRVISSFCFCFDDEPEDQLCNRKHMLEEGLSLNPEDIVHFARMTGNLLMEQLTFSREKGRAASCMGGNDYNCHWKIRLLRAMEEERDASRLASLEWPQLVEEMEMREWEEATEHDGDSLFAEALWNLQNRFAVVGITEDFDRSAVLMKEAFSFTDFEPLHEHTSSDCGIDKELLRRTLIEANATRYFSYDTALYEEALNIFQAQLLASANA